MPTIAQTWRGLAALATTAALAGSLAACSGGSDAASPDGGTVTVLASTNVWADIAATVGGDHVTVTSLISDPNADPHSYEYAPRDVAAVEDADLVVYNGGGYDEFVGAILDSISTDPATVNAFEVHTGAHGGEDGGHAEEGHAEEGHDHGAVNEHVWYDLHTVGAVADHIAEELAALAPQNAAQFQTNADALKADLEALEGIAAGVRDTHDGTEVAQTEPLAGYLLDALGLVDIAPAEFTSAIEGESDPSAAVTAQFRDLLGGNQVTVLVYNAQASSPVTEQLRAVAEEAGVPVVEVTETLPEGVSYFEWMTQAIEDLAAALDNR